MWTYNCRVIRMVDADTADVTIDLGFHVMVNERVRLARIDAPELNTPEGQAAKRWAQAWIDGFRTSAEWPFALTTTRPDPRDKYGRFIAELVAIGTGLAVPPNLSDALLSAGIARPWP